VANPETNNVSVVDIATMKETAVIPVGFAGFRFEGRSMRNLRFELAEDPAIRAQVPPGFAHIAFTSPQGSGFDALRTLYRELQQRRWPDVATLAGIAKATPWLVRAAWWRFAEHRDFANEIIQVLEAGNALILTLQPLTIPVYKNTEPEVRYRLPIWDGIRLCHSIDVGKVVHVGSNLYTAQRIII
jgi:hypothetical protein